MSLGVIPIFWLEFLGFWRKNTKRRNKEKLAFTGPFAAAKGTLAAAKGTLAATKCFVVVKGCLAAARPKG